MAAKESLSFSSQEWTAGREEWEMLPAAIIPQSPLLRQRAILNLAEEEGRNRVCSTASRKGKPKLCSFVNPSKVSDTGVYR